MDDDAFEVLFPDAHGNGSWEFDARWLLLTVSISERLSKLTGLPIDFQFQPKSFANKHHKGARHALGLHMPKKESDN